MADERDLGSVCMSTDFRMAILSSPPPHGIRHRVLAQDHVSTAVSHVGPCGTGANRPDLRVFGRQTLVGVAICFLLAQRVVV